MDMFMDKLAQKLNAQEIIKANTAADTEELNRLRNQLAQYNECLEKLQKLIDEGLAGMHGVSQTSSEEISHLVEEGLAKIREVQNSDAMNDGVNKLSEQLDAQRDCMNTALDEVNISLDDVNSSLDKLNQMSDRMGEKLGGQLDSVREAVAGKLDQLTERLEREADNGTEERFAELDESVHRECVKVYRNVQAVVLEESEKQTKAAAETTAKVGTFDGKLKAVLGISVTALVLSAAGIVLQILHMANWKLF